jgi:hypothetical protein
MNRAVIYLFFLSLVAVFSSCDTKNDFPDPARNYFLKYYGKEGNHEGVDFITNSDGTIIVLGTSRILLSENSDKKDLGKQLYLAKIDEFGQVIWEKSLGGALDEEARDIERTSDGNLVILANVFLTTANRDFILMTVTPEGVKIDSVSFGAQPGIDDDAYSVSELTDGFMVTGSKGNAPNLAADVRDAFQVRFTKSLSVVSNWINSYSQGTIDVAIKGIQYDLNNYLIFGYTNGGNANDPNKTFNYWVYQLNSSGVSNGQNKIGSALDNETVGSMTISPLILGEGYLLSGLSINPTNNQNIYVIKLDKKLSFTISDIQFERKLDDDLGDVAGNRAFSSPSLSGGFLILTNRRGAEGNVDIYLTKIDTRGQKLWDTPVMLGGEGDDFAGSVYELSDGHILVCGTMTLGGAQGQKKIVLAKLNSSGRLSD